MRALRYALLSGMLTVMWGCSAVVVQHAPMVKMAHPEMMTGTWVNEGESMHLHFESDGIGSAAMVEWEDGKWVFQTASLRAIERGSGVILLFGRVQEKGKWEPKEGWILFAWESIGANEARILMPQISAFEAAIKAGTLKGKVEKGEYSTGALLTGSEEEVRTYVLKCDVKTHFSSEDSKVFKRLTK